MSDIVERLRDAQITLAARGSDELDTEAHDAMGDAATEIERLRTEVAAREAAARREGIEAAIEIVERTISPWSIAASDECAAELRALLEDGR